MKIRWVLLESEELRGIRRNNGAIFEIEEWVAKQLIAQKKAVSCVQDGHQKSTAAPKIEKNEKGGK